MYNFVEKFPLFSSGTENFISKGEMTQSRLSRNALARQFFNNVSLNNMLIKISIQ